MNQTTIASEVEFEGIGLHTGKYTKTVLKPAPVNHGYKFKRVDIEGAPTIAADVQNVDFTMRGTRLSENGVDISTVEHLLGTLYALGVDNVLIEVDNIEIPILDGSAQTFTTEITKAGIIEQDAVREYFVVDKTIRHFDPETGSEIIVTPAKSLDVKVMIDFDSSVLNAQYAVYNSLVDFKTEIAPARTFVFLHELESLLRAGLIKGGDLDNAVVLVEKVMSEAQRKRLAYQLGKEDVAIDGTGVLNTSKLRFYNEPARHKLLDLLGDLALLGKKIKGRIHAYKPGHKANVNFTKILREYYLKARKIKDIPQYDPNQEPVCDSVQVMNMLPHRFPFLLVDKIIELSDTHVVGVKNISFDQIPFEGHFPGDPIYPGVLQIESMAQTGGILAISLMEGEEEWDTYFLKVDNFRFKNKVVPGDTMIIKMELVRPIRRGICVMWGRAYVGNKIVSEGELMAQIVKRTTG